MTREPGEKVDNLATKVIGAAIDVHRHLGPGFLEGVYEEALAHELRRRNLPFRRQETFTVGYKGEPVGSGRFDLLVADELLIELKAVEKLAKIHKAQLKSYLKALNLELGILMNFNVPVLKKGLKRVVYTDS